MIERAVFGVENLLDASELGRLIGGALQARPGDENVNGAANLLGGGERFGGRGRKRVVGGFGEKQNRHL